MDATDADAIVFKCPHCDANVEIENPTDNDVLVCPNSECGRPFELQVPRALIVGNPRVDARAEESEYRISNADSHTENTLFETHPAMFRRRPFTYIFLVILAFVGAVGSIYFLFTSARWASILGLVVLAGALLVLGYWWLMTQFKTLTVTDKRVLLRTGLLAKNTTEVRHDDVRNLQVEQSFTERILKVGDLAISSAGQDDLEIVLRGVPHPEEVADLVRQQQD